MFQEQKSSLGFAAAALSGIISSSKFGSCLLYAEASFSPAEQHIVRFILCMADFDNAIAADQLAICHSRCCRPAGMHAGFYTK